MNNQNDPHWLSIVLLVSLLIFAMLGMSILFVKVSTTEWEWQKTSLCHIGKDSNNNISVENFSRTSLHHNENSWTQVATLSISSDIRRNAIKEVFNGVRG
ncbi:hypothetical protein [Candidatus Parabeggiatoa sp. HSG14]|uniref:hypothetical protein n=1 Tax=Candidatus Parabeggiatoa sp. HSG14 TaxID=3055593 RepID=UPI0025A6E360|nr:hypothetical protein [Thiotrichales bacterium HSG14]